MQNFSPCHLRQAEYFRIQYYITYILEIFYHYIFTLNFVFVKYSCFILHIFFVSVRLFFFFDIHIYCLYVNNLSVVYLICQLLCFDGQVVRVSSGFRNILSRGSYEVTLSDNSSRVLREDYNVFEEAFTFCR